MSGFPERSDAGDVLSAVANETQFVVSPKSASYRNLLALFDG